MTPAPIHAAPAGQPSIATSLLLWQDRIPRAPLGDWTRRLRQDVVRLRRECRVAVPLSEAGGTAGNNAALIAAQRGDRAAALMLCERQMWWQHRLSRRAGRAEISAGCVQPWVNLARLEGMAGEWEGAVARLELLRPRGRSGRIALRPLRSDGSGCQPITESGEGFRNVMDSIYVTDTLKILLQNRRFAEVLAFSACVQHVCHPILELRTSEAAVVASCLMGDLDGARRTAQAALQRPDVTAWRRMVFRMRLAEIETCAGELDRAAAMLAPLAHGARALSLKVRSVLQPLYVLMGLAIACHQAGLADDAAAVAAGVHEGATAAEDEVFRIQSLRILTATAPEEERSSWCEMLRDVEQATEYRQFRSGGAPPPDNTAFQALLAEMLDLYAS
jgi:hypothetical protein